MGSEAPNDQTIGTDSILQQHETLASGRSNMTGVREQFVDDMLKGLVAWKSAHARGLLRWGFMVLQKPVGKAK